MNLAETSLFDTITGLPVHPLVVHFAVVLLPLAALLQVALVFVRRWRDRWATPTLLGIVAGTAAAIVAKESGEALAAHLGTPKTHAFWGDILPPVSVALVLVTAVWWWLQRRAAAPARARGAASGGDTGVLLTGLLSAALAVAATVITVLVGHTGAVAAWGGKLDPDPSTGVAAAAPTKAAASASASASATPAAGAAGALTLATVQQHNSTTSCWTAINGTVYDLTAWINRHPGGAAPIKSLCGTDGTAAFTDQHGGDTRVVSRLGTFKVGKLSG